MLTNSQKTEPNPLIDKPDFNHSLFIVGVLILSLILASITGVRANTQSNAQKIIPVELNYILNN